MYLPAVVFSSCFERSMKSDSAHVHVNETLMAPI